MKIFFFLKSHYHLLTFNDYKSIIKNYIKIKMKEVLSRNFGKLIPIRINKSIKMILATNLEILLSLNSLP